MALGEALVASAIGFGIGFGLSMVALELLPFSLGLRAGLWGALGLFTLGGAFFIHQMRIRPLSHDQVVAASLERAAQRRGEGLGDHVRSAVELLNDQDDRILGRSRALCDAHLSATAARIDETRALDSVTSVGLERASPTFLVATGVLFIFGLLGFFAGDQMRASWKELFDAATAEKALQAQARSLLPIVTDLSLSFRYPAYMQEPDRVVAGSSGDISVPRGTEVTIEGRADRAVQGGFLLIGEERAQLSAAEGNRLKGTFTVDAAGSYRFVLKEPDGDETFDPVAHRIALVPDRSPRVSLLAPEQDITVQLEDRVELRYRAQDDHGLTRFRVVVRRQSAGAAPWEKILDEVPGALREYGNAAFIEISETGARPGDRLSVYIEAEDNDTVSGPKRGRSPTRVLTVFSAVKHHRELIDRQAKLLDEMVDRLADELENPFFYPREDPGQKEEAARFARHLKIDEALGEMADNLKALSRDLLDDPLSPRASRRALANMASDLSGPIRRKAELVTLGDQVLKDGRRNNNSTLRRVKATQVKLVGKMETHILFLDDLLNTQKLAEARQIAEEMRRTQKSLQEMLARYQQAPDDATREAILSEIQRLREQLRELMQRLAGLQRDVPDEFLNQEAFASEEMLSDTMSLDQLIEEGKLQEAADALQRMVEQTEKMIDGISDSQDEYGGEEMAKLKKELESFGDALTQLTEKQKALKERSDQMLKEARRRAERKIAKKLERAIKALIEKAKKAETQLKSLDPQGLYPSEQEAANAAAQRVTDLRRALEDRLYDEALDAAEQARREVRMAERSVSDRTRGRYGSRFRPTLKARDRLQSARPKVEEIHRTLKELIPDPGKELNTREMAEMRRNAMKQNALRDQTQKLLEQMQKINEEMPLFGPNHQGQLDRAGFHMQQGASQLRRQRLAEGRREQEQALSQLESLGESLRNSQGSGGGGMPMPLPGGTGSSGRQEGSQGRHSGDRVEIPKADQFRVPDAYRKDILDAMREGAPENWQGEVRDYYEELVK
jgi:hypothetical protein